MTLMIGVILMAVVTVVALEVTANKLDRYIREQAQINTERN